MNQINQTQFTDLVCVGSSGDASLQLSDHQLAFFGLRAGRSVWKPFKLRSKNDG